MHRLLLIVLGAAVLAGCGTTHSSAGAPSRARFVAQADALCATLVAELKIARHGSPDEQLARAITSQRWAIGRLRALQPPAGDERRVAEILRRLDRMQQSMETLRSTQGEEVLAAGAASAIAMDAADQANRRYRLFRHCPVFHVPPGLHRMLHEPRLAAAPAKRPARRQPQPADELHRLARRLVPEGIRVVGRKDCSVGACVTLSLDPGATPPWLRFSSYRRRALANGWRELRPDTPTTRRHAFLFERDGYSATLWLAPPNRPASCPAAPESDCADSLLVEPM